MGLHDAGEQARLDRYLGYYRPYATSHGELDVDLALQQEVKNVAVTVARAIVELRSGRWTPPPPQPDPRPK
jgi:hypothetical protein